MSIPKAHASTGSHWVYTQKGCDHYDANYKGEHEKRKPGQPVPECYRQSCPATWVENGWVMEESY